MARYIVGATVLFVVAVGGNALAAGGSVTCQPSAAKRINRQDVRAYNCLVDDAKSLRADATRDAQDGYQQCKDEENIPKDNQVWNVVDEDASSLKQFASEGLAGAVALDGNTAAALERFRGHYRNPHQKEVLDRAIRKFHSAKTYTEAFKKEIMIAADRLAAHDCARVLDQIGLSNQRADQAKNAEGDGLVAIKELAGL